MNRRLFAAVVAPGCVFQSVMIGGGYGTGREVVQYFTQYGLWGGVGAMAVSCAALSVFLAFLFEAARFFRAYDYRSLCKPLLGPMFPVLEVLNVLMLILVLAVLGAATGQILAERLGLPAWIGLLVLMAPIALLTFLGRETVTSVLTWSSAYLYLIFIIFLAAALHANTRSVAEIAATGGSAPGWARSGLQFALYNFVAAPFILFAIRPIERRSEAIVAGVIAGIFAMTPALLFHIALMTRFEEVVAQALPVYWMIDALDMKVFMAFFVLMLLITFVDTGAGILHGVNDRIDSYMVAYRGAPLSRIARAGVAVAAVSLSTALSSVGIKDLIGRGYGAIAWAYLLVLVAPLLALGTLKMRAVRRSAAAVERAAPTHDGVPREAT